MRTSDIRKKFLDYFANLEHEVVPGSSLIPANDPTLLFTNAGMVQFKDNFLGKAKSSYNRATSCQPCIRAGGKHNDLENVGYTARHHTFFEMMGNFSFGDYFKKDAIVFAWNFITKELKIPKEKLWVTVYQDDKEAEEIWLEDIGVPADRLSRCGEKDNFWSMGDIGPCGPCSEIFYDHGEHVQGGPPGTPEEDGDRYVEIWNLVFMQFDRSADGTLKPLPKPSVDTGMGLERVAAVMQGVTNNYDIDLFKDLIVKIKDKINIMNPSEVSLRVIADHLRSCSFLVMDGICPSNEGRGYVLRRIIRRAIRHGHKLGVSGYFFAELVPLLVDAMGDTYHKLKEKADFISHTFKKEEEQFAKTIDQGMQILSKVLLNAQKEISGEVAFTLYDTYGFPVDLTADIAREHNLTVNMSEFEQRMQKQKDMARSANKFGAKESISTNSSSEFVGYQSNESSSKILDIFINEKKESEATINQDAILVLDRTPLYAESGGQVGDIGIINNDQGEFVVSDTQKCDDAILHIGKVTRGTFSIGDNVKSIYDSDNRDSIRKNHSATHLLHAALRQVLGDHVFQKGSIVDSKRLRFDFSNPSPLTKEQIKEIEIIVNKQVSYNTEVRTSIMSFEEAKESGAMALFGEKYEEDVRVLAMGVDNYSVELCGGTHVQRTGDIGFFKIVSEGGVAAGVRRIEAVTGEEAMRLVVSSFDLIDDIASKLKTKPLSIESKLDSLLSGYKEQEKKISQLQKQLLSGGSSGSDTIKDISGTKVLVNTLPVGDAKALREAIDNYKNKHKSIVVVLSVVNDDKVSIAVGVTKDLSSKINAGKLANHVASQVDGKGGGRPEMAMAGGNDPTKLDIAMNSVYDWVKDNIS